MIALVPAFEPGPNLVRLVRDLRAAAPSMRIVVVDDGSGESFLSVFEAARAEGAAVIGYPRNRGKGVALKFGFRYLIDTHPGEDVVCADSDGQHSVPDILRVADRVATAGGAMVLGGRCFTGRVPLRSRIGNILSRGVFRGVTGLNVRDTQTGLRAYPAAMVPWLVTVDGDRFEYELNLLLDAHDATQRIEEVEIETIYLARNASSHFRPVADSLRVALPLLRYAGSSLASFAIDLVGVQLGYALTGSLLTAVVAARVISGSINFLLNRHLVFGAADGRTTRPIHGVPAGRTLGRDAVRYLVLALALLASSYTLLAALTGLGVALLPAKLLSDVTLYLVSFQVQKRFVFARADGAGAKLTACPSPPTPKTGPGFSRNPAPSAASMQQESVSATSRS